MAALSPHEEVALNAELVAALKDIASHDLTGLRDPYRIILQTMIDTANAALSKTREQPQ